VSFDAFAIAPIAELIEAAGGNGKVSVLIGAGASMEAGLPSWDALLDRLLLRGAESSDLIDAAVATGKPTAEDAAHDPACP
jgi:hypothetical protein